MAKTRNITRGPSGKPAAIFAGCRLVDDVVELSMLESDGFRLETAPACPAEIVRGVFDIVAPEARKKRLALSWRIDSDLEGEFALDAARLR